MIGQLDGETKEVTIIGAGISGLLAGYVLKKRGYQVTLLERAARAGGLIDTQPTPFGDAETAAHSFMVTPPIEHFLTELGVELSPVHPNSKARYIYRDQKMRRIPIRFFEILRILFLFFFGPKKVIDPKTASLADWCRSYLGEPALNYLLAPFVTGIYAATPDELSLKAAFPRLIPLEPRRSLFRELLGRPKSSDPRPRMMAPRHGMKDLVEKLRGHLKSEIRLNSTVNELPKTGQILLCVPANEAAQLLEQIDSKSSAALRKIRYAPLVTCTVFIRREAFGDRVPSGVGVLIPRGEGIRSLGVLFNSSSFPERTRSPTLHSFTVMLGGTTDPEIMDLQNPELCDQITRDLTSLFKLKSAPTHFHITRWERAIPLYSKEILEAQAALSEGFCSLPGRLVFSNFSKEVSLRSLILTLNSL